MRADEGYKINLLLTQYLAVHCPILRRRFNHNDLLDLKGGHLPTSRQCFSIRRERATFSPTSVQAGEVNWILARSALTLSTRPPVEVDPMLINNSSFLTSLETFVCFLSSVLTPSRRRRRKRLISNSTLKYRRYQSNEGY